VPSPLQETSTLRSPSDTVSGLRSPRTPNRRSAYSHELLPSPTTHSLPPSHSLPVERVRAPNPAKKAPSNPALDEIRSVVTRDALREEARKTGLRSQSSTISAPILAASPPTSPTAMSPTTAAVPVDPRPIMAQRTASIDSTVSSISSVTTGSQSSGPQDVASLVIAAGSPEAAILKLVNEKNQAASHNAQLWRLVEKQRSMILGLNRDLEKSLKEKERYRRKLKDQLAQSQSAPLLTSVGRLADETIVGEPSESSALLANRSVEASAAAMPPASPRYDGRKFSDVSDVLTFGSTRSDTPQDSANVSSAGLPTTPLSAASSGNATTRDLDQPSNVTASATAPQVASNKLTEPTTFRSTHNGTPPVSPRAVALPQFSAPSHGARKDASSAVSPPAVAQSFSSPKSPKQANRKAPPAPLQLSPKPVINNVIDASDSEYDDEVVDRARADRTMRGRRKTREEDDREREVLAKQELDYRSRSAKDTKSKTRPTVEKAEVPTNLLSPSMAPSAAPSQQNFEPGAAKSPSYQRTADSVSILRQRAFSDAAGTLPKSYTAPSLMSPGLPNSPRPGDRPLGSPMPRAPNKFLNSIPLSPRAGMAGLPLSPRAPRQPLPLPPQTPLSFTSPHLARAEAYHQQAQNPQGSIDDRIQPSSHPSPEHEQPSTSGEAIPKTPGEVYRGLVTEQYPDLLLPPNALPSIHVKTSSSRMRPARQSFITPKHTDENPVLTLAVHERSDNKQLWRLEKTLVALSTLDQQVKSVCAFRDRFPDKALFAGHAPAKMDARRAALDAYLERMLNAIPDDRAARVLCKFLSTDAFGADGGDSIGAAAVENRPDTPVTKSKHHREGYLTKRGKNFGGWKARYFVLDGPYLKYFEDPAGAHMGSIKLQDAQIGKQSPNAHPNSQEDEENQFRHAFLILEPKRKDSTSLVRHVLCAESDDERDAWVDALLQCVDYKDDEEPEKPPRSTVPDASVARSPRLQKPMKDASPRLQKSMNDLRPPSRSNDIIPRAIDPLRAVHYNETVAGEAPIIGPGIPRNVETPSPPYNASFSAAGELATSNYPNISGPKNLQVISKSGDWGMKPPPMPSSKEPGKDKKRGMFAAFRGRSSSDLAPGGATSPGWSAQGRAVFAVPLAEAVEFAHPVGATTELPAVVYRCIEYLTKKRGVYEEGIFRLSGSNTVVKALRDRFNAEGDVNLVGENKYHDIHAVAGLLKLYLRELPSSILTRELHLEFLHCLEMNAHEKVTALNILVHHLPGPNRALLEALSAFLLEIVKNADINKMNVRNGESSHSSLHTVYNPRCVN